MAGGLREGAGTLIHYVTVGVAMSRPPKVDEYRRYAVVAANQQEAVLVAQQMAACTSVMPVYSEWESSHRAGPVEPFGAMDCSCWHIPWSEDLQRFIDPETWQLNEACPWHGTPPVTAGPRPVAREQAQDVPHLCETSRCWQDCRDRTDKVREKAELDAIGMHPIGVLSPGRVACRWCPWSAEYADEIRGYRDLVAHWASGDCNKGDDECNSASPPQRAPWWKRWLLPRPYRQD